MSDAEAFLRQEPALFAGSCRKFASVRPPDRRLADAGNGYTWANAASFTAEGGSMPGIAELRAVVLDCPDPRALAEFYRQLVGGEITKDEDDWVALRDGGSVLLSFQRAPDHRPPDWPGNERPQQFHIDVTVADVDQAERRVLALGATRHEVQPGEEGGYPWRVFLDPAGHPFCLVWD